MNRMICKPMLLLFFSSLPFAAQAAQPSDHPLVGRYEGSEILEYQQKAFDDYVLPLGEIQGEWGEGGFEESRRLEGKITWIGYRNPRGRSTLEVFRSYEDKLADEGFETLFSCESNRACGSHWFVPKLVDLDPVHGLDTGDTANSDDGVRYLAAKLKESERTVYAQILIYDEQRGPYTRIRVIEQKARETDKIVVKADEMARKINDAGRVALYGLYFDTDKATLKSKSEPTLKQIAKLLNDNSDISLLVVGHTDNQGDLQYNEDLSERRAASVVDALVNDHNIDRERLAPHGVAFLAPVASNETSNGRAKNRRVELVGRSGDSD